MIGSALVQDLGTWHVRTKDKPPHDPRTSSILGIALGVAFTVCFLTGVISHLVQNPPSWFLWPSRPAGLFRVTQGLHVATGYAAIPLLLAKLWSVYPKFWKLPPVTSVFEGVERALLVPLVGGAVFQLFSGTANTFLWYPWPFFFPTAHYWMSYVIIGALVVHVAVKFPVVRQALARGGAVVSAPLTVTRRLFLGGAAGAAAALTAMTSGQTVFPLRHIALLAPRLPTAGPQNMPVNKAASEARVVELALDPNYRLVVEGKVTRRLELSLDDLRSRTQHEATLPIACVEGWSATGHWKGVRVRDLLDEAGASTDATVLVESLETIPDPGTLYGRSELNRLHARDRDTLLALELNGEELHIDHGFPTRLIGPNRPGTMQTKWVTRLVVT